ncbi:hypothetical protein HanXRQr2_Chr05g0213541 [Helianthus annuus]|uniref:Uncharacterized protein n=1 Tax=Helianthus annuus TaxID=4232 RepID=A0A9K3IZJ5_HELAN|nr:hypothetical protein HanXRQr2_Chr05g0213541 [Helianthus annuus]KAJ0584492.1 hypothetical protein HanHA89_Chr05g0189261 [Helianthus annuus]KAJ0922657.1 hypothetical protein HanPSC8_Chr05g0206441 [Helianthus annuus]
MGCIMPTLLERPTPVVLTTKLCASGVQWLESGVIGKSTVKSAFTEEKAAFEAEKKSEEWGREGLRSKLRAAEEFLSKERAEWKEVCKKDNQRMYSPRSKITDLEAQIATLKRRLRTLKRTRSMLRTS